MIIPPQSGAFSSALSLNNCQDSRPGRACLAGCKVTTGPLEMDTQQVLGNGQHGSRSPRKGVNPAMRCRTLVLLQDS